MVRDINSGWSFQGIMLIRLRLLRTCMGCLLLLTGSSKSVDSQPARRDNWLAGPTNPFNTERGTP